jgi:hypothetical protein
VQRELEPGRPPSSRDRGVARWAACASLLPIPLWFIVTTVLAPTPAWRAEYRQNADFSGAGAIVAERELSRYWDRQNDRVPGELEVRSFSARWDGCLSLDEAREIPFMLVTDGSASFTIDGAERLSATSSAQRATRGEVLRLEPGTHALGVVLRSHGWASIALLASFDGAPPKPLGSGRIAAGVRAFPPAADGCSAP